MTQPSMDNSSPYIDVAMDKIGESYARFRLVSPRGERSMLKSIKRFGQLTPVVVGREDNGRHEMIDGFKRLRALRNLNGEAIRARVLDGHRRALKAAMIELNREARSMGSMEEALLAQSLYREDGLDQVEIASLLGRDKSWASRRIALIEKLSDEVLEHLRLGLITPTHGRELIRLPRGNQKATLDSVLKHRLSTRETGQLVDSLLESPQCAHDNILWLPLDILDARNPPGTPKGPAAPAFQAALSKLSNCCAIVDQGIDKGLFMEIPEQHASIVKVVAGTLKRLEGLARKEVF